MDICKSGKLVFMDVRKHIEIFVSELEWQVEIVTELVSTILITQ